jgi:hypothetical protein
MRDFMKRVIADRLGGDKPSPIRAFGAATVVGVAAAGITYKALRR